MACNGESSGVHLGVSHVATCRHQVVERAQSEDLNRSVRYQVSFIRNAQGRVITDVRSLSRILPCPLRTSLLEHAAVLGRSFLHHGGQPIDCPCWPIFIVSGSKPREKGMRGAAHCWVSC